MAERRDSLTPRVGVGSRLGPYELVAELGAGGMARLFVGQRRGPGGFSRRVAIKVLHPEWEGSRDVIHMFLDEARLSACVQHPNVVQVEELGEQDSQHYIVMQHIDGVALSELMRGFATRRQLIPVEVAVAIAAQVADGLHAAHESKDEHGEHLNLVHRDVSPQNILIDAQGHVKLIDFGVAKARDRLAITSPGEVKGKLAYMSPQQLANTHIDRQIDVFALGVVLWEMLTLRRLFHRETDLDTIIAIRQATIDPPSRFRGDLPPNLDDVMLTMLARKLEERFGTTAAVRRALLISCPQAQTIEASVLGAVVRDVAADALAARRSLLPDDEPTSIGKPIGM